MSRTEKLLLHARCFCPGTAFVCCLHKPCECCCAATIWCSVHASRNYCRCGAAWRCTDPWLHWFSVMCCAAQVFEECTV